MIKNTARLITRAWSARFSATGSDAIGHYRYGIPGGFAGVLDRRIGVTAQRRVLRLAVHAPVRRERLLTLPPYQ